MIVKAIKSFRNFREMNSAKQQMNSRRYTRSKFGDFLILLIVVLAGLFTMLPLIYAVSTSFKPLDEILLFPPKFLVRRPTLENYIALSSLLSDQYVPLTRYIFNSVFITIFTTIVYILISSMAAFGLSKSKFKCKNALFMIVQFALLFNTYTLSVPQYLILSEVKVIDTYWAYILPQLATTLGVFLTKQYIEGYIPDAFIEAAKIDGAGYFRIFFRIVLPLIKPILLTLLLFSFRDVWAFIPQGTIFSESIKTLPFLMSQISGGGIARSGSVMAITVIMMTPPVIVYLISQSNVMDSMSSAGIKE
ncbi:MAG: carbohydrate ABC transporter permease [Clostridia bacterium]|nr:carbohydrate ABC transporter permease [Clostridia bacterium]